MQERRVRCVQSLPSQLLLLWVVLGTGSVAHAQSAPSLASRSEPVARSKTQSTRPIARPDDAPRVKRERQGAKASYRDARDSFRQTNNFNPASDKPGDTPEAKAARQTALNKMKRARRLLRLSHRHDAQRVRTMNPTKLKALRNSLQKRENVARKNRTERASAHRDLLKRTYGDKLNSNTVRLELGAHAWRVARLQRLINIAEISGNQLSLKRAKNLLEIEKEEHSKRLKMLVGPAHLVELPTSSDQAPKIRASPRQAGSLIKSSEMKTKNPKSVSREVIHQ